MEISAIKGEGGGGVQRFMTNAIRNFHIFLRLPREDQKDQVASNFRSFFTFMIDRQPRIYASDHMIYFPRSDRHDNDCRQLHCL